MSTIYESIIRGAKMINKTISFLGFWFAALVFLIAVPTYAFILAYTGGPREHIKFDIEQQNYTKVKVANLNSFAPTDPTQSMVLIKMLQEADAKTQVIINIKENTGGYLILLQLIEKAIKNSKADVIIKVDHFGFSCGGFILGYGNKLFLPYDALIMFHNGAIQLFDPVTNQSTYVKITSTNPDPRVKAAYAQALEMTIPYLQLLTPSEM